MSGNYFLGRQHALEDIASDIDYLIQKNDCEEVDHYGDKIGRGFSKKTIEEFKRAYEHLLMVKVFVDRIDYLVSGDDSEETFHKRLKEDLDKGE